MEDCPNCGQRLRQDWVRCPRCRYWLGEQTAAATPAPAVPPRRLAWLIGAGVGGLIVAITLGMLNSADRAAVPSRNASADSPVMRPATPIPAPEPRAFDPVQRAEREADDQLRYGNAAYAQGDLAGALAKYEAAVAAAPDDPDARNNLAQVLVRLKRTEDALPHLDEAVRIDPQRWAFRFNRARAYGQLNRLPEAITEYQTAAQLFPEDYATPYNLGLTFMRLKRYEEAAAALEQAVKLAPGEPSFLITLGTAYVGAERPDRAKAAFQQFLELAPNDPEVPRVKALLGAMAAAGQ